MLAICAVCWFCGKEFIMLGRHTWRCKERLNQNPSVNTVNQIPVMHSPIRISNTNDIKCCCSKSCKGTRGLKMHQRSCRLIHGKMMNCLQTLKSNRLKTLLIHPFILQPRILITWQIILKIRAFLF